MAKLNIHSVLTLIQVHKSWKTSSYHKMSMMALLLQLPVRMNVLQTCQTKSRIGLHPWVQNLFITLSINMDLLSLPRRAQWNVMKKWHWKKKMGVWFSRYIISSKLNNMVMLSKPSRNKLSEMIAQFLLFKMIFSKWLSLHKLKIQPHKMKKLKLQQALIQRSKQKMLQQALVIRQLLIKDLLKLYLDRRKEKN